MTNTNSRVYTHYWLVKETVDTYPDAAAQMYRTTEKSDFQTKSFQQLFAEIQETALGLDSLGMQKGDTVGLIADVGHRWLPTSLGIGTIGGIDVPRGTDATPGDLQYIFQHAECKFIFLETPKVYDKIQNILAEFTHLHTIIFFAGADSVQAQQSLKILSLKALQDLGKQKLQKNPTRYEQLAKAVKEEDTLTIIYTSGTTGTPKGVVHTHKSLTWEVFNLVEDVAIPPLGAAMGFLPPWHVAERLIELASLKVASSVAFTSVATLGKDLQIVNPTFLISVPRVWESFYNRIMSNVQKAPVVARALFHFAHFTALRYSKWKDTLLGLQYRLEEEAVLLSLGRKIMAGFGIFALFLPNLLAQKILTKVKRALGNRILFAISGAGALPEYIDRLFYSIGIPIIDTYGMTETCGVSVRRGLSRTVIGTVGKPLGGVSIKLLDTAGNVITNPNTKGIAYHKGPNIMKEYYKQPEKTKEVLSDDGWLNSGDILILTSDGDLKFTGRAKDTIVLLGGENVEPLPIEDALKQSPYIVQCVVVGQDKKNIAALLVPDTEAILGYFQEQNIQVSPDPSSWNDDIPITNLFKSEIKRLNAISSGFKVFEKVTNFYILAEEFQIGVELTQTLKVKRNIVFEKYENEIESLYK
ncbi:MAG: AMP-binding protein [Spirochaetota bacterium]